MAEEIINRVEQSGLLSLDLEDFYLPGERVQYDISINLYQGMVLREKDFRADIKEFDWSIYQDKYVNITCTVDAIIPTWAYMLLISKIEPFAKYVIIGTALQLEQALFQKQLSNINPLDYTGAKVVVKGCSKFPVPLFAYGELTRLLLSHASSVMFGEPCSTVPVYKKPRTVVK
jgi:hypothetical protein